MKRTTTKIYFNSRKNNSKGTLKRLPSRKFLQIIIHNRKWNSFPEKKITLLLFKQTTQVLHTQKENKKTNNVYKAYKYDY